MELLKYSILMYVPACADCGSTHAMCSAATSAASERRFAGIAGYCVYFPSLALVQPLALASLGPRRVDCSHGVLSPDPLREDLISVKRRPRPECHGRDVSIFSDIDTPAIDREGYSTNVAGYRFLSLCHSIDTTVFCRL